MVLTKGQEKEKVQIRYRSSAYATQQKELQFLILDSFLPSYTS